MILCSTLATEEAVSMHARCQQRGSYSPLSRPVQAVTVQKYAPNLQPAKNCVQIHILQRFGLELRAEMEASFSQLSSGYPMDSMITFPSRAFPASSTIKSRRYLWLGQIVTKR